MSTVFIRSKYFSYFLGMILILELIGIINYTQPGDFLYKTKKMYQSLQIKVALSHVAKAKIYLGEAHNLQTVFSLMQKKNAKDPNLALVADELVAQDRMAVDEMDKAKKMGTNVDEQVEVLCEDLEFQYKYLKTGFQTASAEANTSLDKSSLMVKQFLDQAMMWEE